MFVFFLKIFPHSFLYRCNMLEITNVDDKNWEGHSVRNSNQILHGLQTRSVKCIVWLRLSTIMIKWK